MRHAIGWGFAVTGAFAVGGGIAIDAGAYMTGVMCALVTLALAYLGPEMWK